MLPFSNQYLPDPELLGELGVEWFSARIEPQSFRCFLSPWVADLPADTRKTFVFASGYEPSRFAHYADICRDHADWSYHELDGPHFLMCSHPDEVASIIVNA